MSFEAAMAAIEVATGKRGLKPSDGLEAIAEDSLELVWSLVEIEGVTGVKLEPRETLGMTVGELAHHIAGRTPKAA